MGTSQSTDSAKTQGKVAANSPKPVPKESNSARGKLTYQESFDIRNRPQTIQRRPYERNEMGSLSSNSESELNSGYSYASSKKNKVKRNKSNIRPPMLLFTNLSKNLEDKQKRVNFGRKKSMSSNSEHSQSTVPRDSFDNTDLEEEIDMILNDTKSENGPWYHEPKTSSGSSTVSIKQSENETNSLNEDLYSSKSLPTPSFYLYLAFDDNMKKSKSIEVLDAPNYFFLNYEEDKCQSESDDEVKMYDIGNVNKTNK